jgi:hypothetical protein
VGDKVTYRLQNGESISFVAELGDNYWVLGKKALVYQNMNPKNPIVGPGEIKQPVSDSKKDEAVVAPGAPNENKSGGIPWWVWVIAAVLLLGFGGAFVEAQQAKRNKKEAAKDPVTSGNPMRRNGVTDEQAPAYMQEVANRQFNRPGLNVTNITRGRLSGENLEVYYAGQLNPERRTFNDFPAYRGQVNINGHEQFVYFLQGCGNDVRMGNYFSGQNIRFIPEEVLQTAPQQPAVIQPATTQPVVVETTITKAAKLAEEHIAAGNDVTLTVTNKTLQLNVTAKEMLNLNMGNNNHKELPAVVQQQ